MCHQQPEPTKIGMSLGMKLTGATLVALLLVAFILDAVRQPAKAQDMSAMNTMQQINTQNLINQAAGVYDSPRPAPKPAPPAQQVIVVPEGAKVYYDGKEIRPINAPAHKPPPRFVQGIINVYDSPMVYVQDNVAKTICYRGNKERNANWSCVPLPGHR